MKEEERASGKWKPPAMIPACYHAWLWSQSQPLACTCRMSTVRLTQHVSLAKLQAAPAGGEPDSEGRSGGRQKDQGVMYDWGQGAGVGL